MKNKVGRPRKYKKGEHKKTKSIRLTDKDKKLIERRYASVQEFFEYHLVILKYELSVIDTAKKTRQC